jgi:predicted RNA-binding Zn-ribbon protein involved in translation (DUF1610 family)/anti-anti-sigma regulatory factor
VSAPTVPAVTTVALGRLTATIAAAAAGPHLTLVGRIDDGAPLGGLLGQLAAAGDVTIDTDGVTFVNSVGLREWIRLLHGLGARGQRIVLERLADVLITQMNTIGDLRGRAEVRSFHAPYACPACGAEVDPVVDAVAHRALLATGQAPALPCPECGAAMALADFPERYLSIFK